MQDTLDQDNNIKDLLLSTNMSMKDIGAEVGLSEYKLSKRIKELGLTWVRRKDKKMSRGHAALYHMLQRVTPNEKVVTEHHIGERLRLDIYCPSLELAIEYHGIQHFQYVEHFHKTIEAFRESQERDLRKEELCKEKGIALVTFRYNDNLDEDVVFSRLLDAIKTSEKPKEAEQKPKSSYKGNEYYEAAKEKQRAWRKDQHLKMKALRKKKE